MRFRVPQNLDIKDTMFFGLSFTQLLYLGGAIGLIFFLFFVVRSVFLVVILGGPVLVLALLLSFFSYNNQPFVILAHSVLSYITKTKMYVYRKSGSERYVQRKVVSQEGQPNGRLVDNNLEKIKELDKNLMFHTSQEDETEPKFEI